MCTCTYACVYICVHVRVYMIACVGYLCVSYQSYIHDINNINIEYNADK